MLIFYIRRVANMIFCYLLIASLAILFQWDSEGCKNVKRLDHLKAIIEKKNPPFLNPIILVV